MKGLVFTLGFAVGAAAGSIATWRFLKTKYEQLAREEIEEVREYYANKSEKKDEEETNTDDSEEDSTEEKEDSKAVYTEYSKLASLYSGDATEKTKDEGGEQPMSRQEPYVISPAEFGEIESYETETLIYYNDGVLADSDNNRIDDIESCIGYESLNHFGEYVEGDDSVYVRNDEAMTDYEVLLDESNYADLEGVD